MSAGRMSSPDSSIDSQGAAPPIVSHWIDGEAVVAAAGGARAPVYNPSGGDVVREVPLGGASEVDRAVRSAHRALPGWSHLPAPRRARVLFRFKELLEAHSAA